MRKLIFFILTLIPALLCAQAELPKYTDSNLSVEERSADLLNKLNLEEKCSLLMYNSPAIPAWGIDEYNWWNECLHGVARAGKATVFPQAIGLAATFNTDLVFQVADAISTEARAKHSAALKMGNRDQYSGLTFWTPNVNIFRDPRWGRGQETYGEDPFLTSVMGVAIVQGLQGNDPLHLKVSACAKHFVVHSGPESIRHEFDAAPSQNDFYDTYVPAFKALVDGGVESVMCAYNRTWGEPCCGSVPLMKDLLREKWGFMGHVVSDCWALDDIWLRHRTVETQVEAAAMAARAGTNLNCGYLYSYLPDAVSMGLISEQTVDSLLIPVLHTRFKLGLFDADSLNPWGSLSPDTVNCFVHRQLAYQAAVESCVLLKNEHDLLPLNRDTLKNIFITGPTAAETDALLGNYNGFSGQMTTILEGIMGRLNPGTMADYTRGCLLAGDTVFHGFWQAGFADVIVAVMGNTRLLEGEDGDAMLSDHGGDRKDLRLPYSQELFLQRLRQLNPGKKIILVLTGGSAINLSTLESYADAILMTWYPGEQGGNAVADILFGDANPSGKLPVTFYQSVDDLPAFDDYSMDGRTYRFFRGKPLYPFGYGLSYSDFVYVSAQANQQTYDSTEVIRLTVELKNTSERSGFEVVQVYAQYPDKHESTPIKSLVGFVRVEVPAGGSAVAEVVIPVKSLQLWNNQLKDYQVRKGEYLLQVGSLSEDVGLEVKVKVDAEVKAEAKVKAEVK